MKKIIFAAIIVALFASCEANSPSNPKTNILAHSTFRYDKTYGLNEKTEYLLMFDNPYEGNVTFDIIYKSAENSGLTHVPSIRKYRFDGYIITISSYDDISKDSIYHYGAYRNDTIYYEYGIYTRVCD